MPTANKYTPDKSHRQRCLETLESVADELGHPPTQAEFRECDTDISASTIASEFDGWVVAKEAAGFDITVSRHRSYNSTAEIIKWRNECLSAIRELATELDEPPRLVDFEEADNGFSRTQVERLFGTWNQAKRAADVEIIVESKISNARNRSMRALQATADELGHSPTVAEYRDADTPLSASVIRDEFESWSAAQRAAGLAVTDPSNISKDECIAAIQTVAKAVDEPPTVTQFRERDTSVSLKAVLNRFESWNSAKEAANVDKQSFRDSTHPHAEPPQNNEEQSSASVI
jgi:cell fate (sporulation/competence/biofilm development) regulator YmcA (YheA/YmcA/DUF963 family)